MRCVGRRTDVRTRPSDTLLGMGDASLLRTPPCLVPTVFPSQPFPRTAPTVTHFLSQTAWNLPLGIFRGLAWTSS